MNADREKAKSIFLNAAEIASLAERDAYIAAACGDNQELRLEVDTLLAHHAKAGQFLDGVAADRDVTARQAAPEKIGESIGPYKLLQQIGEGGMGTVYMAEQSKPIQRKVAIKVIKPGMDSAQVIARFEAERQALALMDHVNIARVLDGGTTASGRPYFVMELVHGVPITKYCDDNHLTPRERLDLFVPVCQAIQYAHQKGIIHRDIKPSNVMVTLYDGKPVPKVIDFGVAKATEQKLTERTLFTHYGTLVGTLEYMSPEQAEMSALGVDTRSDIYSLGVLLYELLTGTTPIGRKRMKEAAYGEILRLIKEEDPPPPSTRLSDSGDALASISALRHTEPAKLTKLIRGELDWIVMKCLEKDRNRRYETANGVAADLQRHLADETVQACPPSMQYWLRKVVKKNKGTVFAAAVVLLALVVGIVGTTWGMVRATSAEADALSETRQKADALAEKEIALADAKEQLFLALVHQARAQRASGRVGQRFKAIEAIQAAARIRSTPELRTEAIAALVLSDMEIVKEFDLLSNGRGTLAFDHKFTRCARLNPPAEIVVSQFIDGAETQVARITTKKEHLPYGVVISPDGRFVAHGYGLRNGVTRSGICVWDLDGPKPALALDETPGLFESAIAFHHSGQFMAVGHADKSVSIYDLPARRRVQRLLIDSAPMHLEFHPHDQKLAIASGRAVQVFDLDTAKELSSLRHGSPVTQTLFLSWHPNGRDLAVACNDRRIHVWNTETATEAMVPWVGHSIDGLVIAFAPEGDLLASSDWSGRLRLWDVGTGRTLLTPSGYFGVRFSSNGRLFGPEYDGKKIRFWRVAGGNALRLLRPRNAGPLDNISAPVIHPDGQTLAAASLHQINFFDLASGEELGVAQMPFADAARPVLFDSSGHSQVPAGDDVKLQNTQAGGWITGGQSGLYFWPIRNDSSRADVTQIGPPRLITPNPGGGHSAKASASSDGRIVAVPQGHSTLVLHRDSPTRRLVLGPQFDVRFSAVSPDGQWIVTSSWGSDGISPTIRVWDSKTGAHVRDLSTEAFASAKFSPDGAWLMTSDLTGSRQFDVGNWNELRRFEQGGAFAFSPDSRLLAINDEFSVIRLLEAATGREVAKLTGPEPSWYKPACFTPDGSKLIASSSAETALYVWDLRLIRQQLKELSLDWEWPEFPPVSRTGPRPRRIEVLLGNLFKAKSPS